MRAEKWCNQNENLKTGKHRTFVGKLWLREGGNRSATSPRDRYSAPERGGHPDDPALLLIEEHFHGELGEAQGHGAATMGGITGR